MKGTSMTVVPPQRAAGHGGAPALLAGCGRPQGSAASERRQERHVQRAARSTIAISVDYPARIKAAAGDRRVGKGARPGGDVRADVGQRVRRGEVLFTLESTDYDAQARQARAALDSARANLTRTSDSSLSSQIIQAQAAVKQAQVQYDDAKDLSDGRRSSSRRHGLPAAAGQREGEVRQRRHRAWTRRSRTSASPGKGRAAVHGRGLQPGGPGAGQARPCPVAA